MASHHSSVAHTDAVVCFAPCHHAMAAAFTEHRLAMILARHTATNPSSAVCVHTPEFTVSYCAVDRFMHSARASSMIDTGATLAALVSAIRAQSCAPLKHLSMALVLWLDDHHYSLSATNGS